MKLECKHCGTGNNVKLGEDCCTEWRCSLCMTKQTFCLMLDIAPTKTVVFKPDFKLSEDKNDNKEEVGRGNSISGTEDSRDIS